MIDFSKYEVLSFDCYGTLIDWETGIIAALRPILSAVIGQPDLEVPDLKTLVSIMLSN